MFGMGMGELVLVLVIALLVVGPDKLPDAAKAIGKGIRDFRRHTQDLQDTLEQDEKLGEAVRELRSALRDDPFRVRPLPPRPAVPPPLPPAAEPASEAAGTPSTGTAESGSPEQPATPAAPAPPVAGDQVGTAGPHGPPVVIPAANTVAKNPARPAPTPAPPATGPSESATNSPGRAVATASTDPASGDDSAHG